MIIFLIVSGTAIFLLHTLLLRSIDRYDGRQSDGNMRMREQYNRFESERVNAR